MTSVEPSVGTSTSSNAERMATTESAVNLLAQGKRNMVCGEIPIAVNQFQEACKMLAKEYGEMAKECADAYFSYGQALLDLARMENGVLGNALQGDTDEEESSDSKSDQFEKVEMEAGEREKLRQEVYDAMSDKERAEADKKKNEAESGTKKAGETVEVSMDTDDDQNVDKKEPEKGDKETQAEKDEKETPAVKEGKATPAEKEDKATPAEKEDKATPAEKEDKATPAEKEGKATPAEKEDKETPAEKEVKEKLEKKDEEKPTEKEKVEDAKKDATKPPESSKEPEKQKDEKIKAETDKKEKDKTPDDTKEETKDGKDAKKEETKEEEKDGEEEKEGEESMEEGEGTEEEGEGGTEEEGEDTADDVSQDESQDGENPDDVSNLQLAWEMLELAKLIYSKDDSKEAKLRTAESHLKLGEVGMETEQYEEAIKDFNICLTAQKEILESDNRLLAETYYQLGLAYCFAKKFTESVDSYNAAIKCIESRIAKLNAILEKATPEEKESKDFDTPVYKANKEVGDLNELLPDIRSKIDDCEDERKNMDELKNLAKEALGGLAAAVAPSKPEGETSKEEVKTMDISHLIKRKRKSEDNDDDKAKKSRQEDGAGDAPPVTNGHAEKEESKKTEETKS